MLIPNKFSGYSFNGVRRCFGGAGGGGGGDGGTGGDPASIGDSVSTTSSAAPGGPGSGDNTQTYTNRTGVNTNRGAITGMNFTGGNTSGYGGPGVNTTQGMATLGAAKGTPWGQSGAYYNDLLNQGFSSDQIKTSASSMYGAPSDANWGAMVQNAGMNSPTGRPMAGSDQFFQPVYNSSYQNYARPSTQFDTSMYGTQPMNSPAFNSGMSRGNINNTIENFYRTNPMGRDAPMSDTLNFMRDSGVNREDFQSWAGKNNYGPQMSMPSAQTQQPFNPYTNSSGYGGYMPQMQSPFSFQQPSYQQQSYQPSYQQQRYQPSYQPSYQQQSYQPSYQPQYNPYQMQSPFSYQQPAAQPNYGPSQAIIGRSSQMRGTPNVMRRAEGGIASLMDDVE